MKNEMEDSLKSDFVSSQRCYLLTWKRDLKEEQKVFTTSILYQWESYLHGVQTLQTSWPYAVIVTFNTIHLLQCKLETTNQKIQLSTDEIILISSVLNISSALSGSA